METVAGKTAFITGGASGVGFGMAQVLAGGGANIMIADINIEGASAAAAKLREAGGKASAVRLNVARADAWDEALTTAEQAFGPIHILCNNAGVTGAVDMDVEEVSEAAWSWCRSINLDSVLNGIRAFVPRAKAHGQGGHIVNTGSAASFLAFPKFGDYTASKMGVAGFTEVLRQELAPHNIGVSLLCPGTMKTGLLVNSRKILAADPNAKNIEQRYNPALDAGVAEGLEPEILGRLVLRAIVANRANIFTHPDYRGLVEARFNEVLEDFAWAAENVEGHAKDTIGLG